MPNVARAGAVVPNQGRPAAVAQTLFKLIDALDDDDDVQTVWGNYDIPDAVMEKLG